MLNALGEMQKQIDEVKTNSVNPSSNQFDGISMPQNPIQMIPGLPSISHGSGAGPAQQRASEYEVLQAVKMMAAITYIHSVQSFFPLIDIYVLLPCRFSELSLSLSLSLPPPLGEPQRY